MDHLNIHNQQKLLYSCLSVNNHIETAEEYIEPDEKYKLVILLIYKITGPVEEITYL